MPGKNWGFSAARAGRGEPEVVDLGEHLDVKVKRHHLSRSASLLALAEPWCLSGCCCSSWCSRSRCGSQVVVWVLVPGGHRQSSRPGMGGVTALSEPH